MREAASAAACVRAGGVICYPTETVYGLGCDPREAAAVERIRAIKGRDADKPMLALTDEWARVERWVVAGTPPYRRLMEARRPITLLFAPGPEAPPALVGPDGWIALRRTEDAFCRALVAAAGVPVLSTSANRAGQPPAARSEDLDPAVTRAVDLVVDAGRPLGGVPSTVVRVDGDDVVVLREGAVQADEVRALARG